MPEPPLKSARHSIERRKGEAVHVARCRLLIASHDGAVRSRLISLARELSLTATILEAPDGKQAVDAYFTNRPDMTFIDVFVPALDCITIIHAICAKTPDARIILLGSSPQDNWVNKALRAGAKGFLPREANKHDLADCICRVSGGQTYALDGHKQTTSAAANLELTCREAEVLRLMASDMTNMEIGAALFISEGTVKIHVHHILFKLGVESRSGAIVEGVRRHLLRF